MSDPGDQLSDTMASLSKADPDDPLLDLANLFEMAAASDPLDSAVDYEDPIEDLAMFLENAICWACNKALIGPDGTFWPFSQLPAEIRTMIWEECIPSQIHLAAEHVNEYVADEKMMAVISHLDADWGFDDLRGIHDNLFNEEASDDLEDKVFHHFKYNLFHDRTCQPRFPTDFRKKLPFIARVNHEARHAAISYVNRHIKLRHNVALVHTHWYGGDVDRIDESPVWLNINTDTVLVNIKWVPADDHPEPATSAAVDGTLFVRTDRLFGMVERNMIKTALLPDALATMPMPMYYRLTSGQHRVQMVVGVVNLPDLSDRQAALTDLFGLFGEENMALVPANNSSLLRKLFSIHVTSGVELFLEESFYERFNDIQPTVDLSPADFNTYEAQMLNVADLMMSAGMQQLAFEELDDPVVGAQWTEDVLAGFRRLVEPVFFVHRCDHPALLRAPLY